MFVRVLEFGETHRDLFPESTVGRQAFAAVATAVTQLSGHAVSKMSMLGEGRHAKTIARTALVGRLEAMARTARVVQDAPGFDDRFRLPARLTDQTVLTAGRVFVHDAEACTAPFLAHGMPATFLADLNELVEKFEQAVRGREAARGGQAAARAGIAAAWASGFAAVCTLDVVVANLFHADPVMLAVWARDRRVGYPQGKRRPSRRSVGTPIAALARTA
jgi:hypothetical protein